MSLLTCSLRAFFSNKCASFAICNLAWFRYLKTTSKILHVKSDRCILKEIIEKREFKEADLIAFGTFGHKRLKVLFGEYLVI